jgi:hypothetical protein
MNHRTEEQRMEESSMSNVQCPMFKEKRSMEILKSLADGRLKIINEFKISGFFKCGLFKHLAFTFWHMNFLSDVLRLDYSTHRLSEG